MSRYLAWFAVPAAMLSVLAVDSSAATVGLLVGSLPNSTASYTFTADPSTLSEASGYSPLVWGGADPQAVASGDTVYIGAGGQIFRYAWDGVNLVETGASANIYGSITNLAIAGNGDLLVNSNAGASHYTFVADPTTLAEKSGYTPLVWGASEATATTGGAAGGNDVYFGQNGIIYRYTWNGSAFSFVNSSANIWGTINNLALAGNGDLIINSVGATFVADPTTFADKSGSNYLNWSGLTPTATTFGPGNGNEIWIGAGPYLFKYTWNGAAFTELASTSAAWGQVSNLALVEVPEPSAAILLMAGASIMALRRRSARS